MVPKEQLQLLILTSKKVAEKAEIAPTVEDMKHAKQRPNLFFSFLCFTGLFSKMNNSI